MPTTHLALLKTLAILELIIKAQGDGQAGCGAGPPPRTLIAYESMQSEFP